MLEQVVQDDSIQRQDEAGVCRLTLNRPDQYNTLSEEVLAAFQLHLDDIEADDSVRCVVIAAKGPAFCAGHDLKQMRANPDRDYYRRLFNTCAGVMKSIVTLPVPVIAEVQGLATAAGCQLVATCDMAIAADGARFAVSGIKLGLFCSTPAVAVSRNVNAKTAFEMLVTGDFMDAQTAVEKGLINDAVAPQVLGERVKQLTDSICEKSPVVVRIGKAMFYKQLEMGLAEAYDFAGETMACNMMEQDTCEGIDAFIEKRKPVWKSG